MKSILSNLNGSLISKISAYNRIKKDHSIICILFTFGLYYFNYYQLQKYINPYQMAIIRHFFKILYFLFIRAGFKERTLRFTKYNKDIVKLRSDICSFRRVYFTITFRLWLVKDIFYRKIGDKMLLFFLIFSGNMAATRPQQMIKNGFAVTVLSRSRFSLC